MPIPLSLSLDRRRSQLNACGTLWTQEEEERKSKNGEQDALIQLHHTQLSKTCAELSARALEKNAEYDQRLRAISSSTAEHQQQLALETKRLDEKFATRAEIQDDAVEATKTHVAEQLHAAEERARARAATVDKRFESDRDHMIELTTALGERITETASGLSNTMREVEARQKEVAAALDTKVSDALAQQRVASNDRAVRHDQRLDILERDSTSTQQLAAKNEKAMELLDTSVQDNQREAIESTTRLQSQFAARSNTVDDKLRQMQDRVQDSAKDLRASISMVERSAVDAVDQLSAKLSTSEAMFEKGQAASMDKAASLEEKLDDELVRLTQTGKALEDKLSQRCAINEQKLSNQEKQWADDLRDLEKKFGEHVTSQELHMITFTEKMQDTQSNLTLRYDEKHEMQDKAIKEIHESVERYQSNIAQQSSAMEKRLTAKNGSLEKELSDMRHRMQERQQQWTQSYNDLEAVQHEKHMTHSKQADEQWQKLTTLCNDLERSMALATQEQSDRREEVRSVLTANLEELDERLRTQDEMYSAATEKTSAKLDLLVTQSEHSISHLTESTASLQSQLTSLQGDHLSRIDAAAATAKASVDRLGESLRENAAKTTSTLNELSTSLDSESRKTTAALSAVDQRISEQSSSQNARLGEITTRLTTRLDVLDKSTEERVTKDHMEISQLRASLTDLEASTKTLVGSVDAKSANAVEALAVRTDDQHQHALDAFSDLQETMQQKIDAHTAQQSELSATVAANHKHVTGVTSKIEKQCSDRSTQQEKRFEAQLLKAGDAVKNLAQHEVEARTDLHKRIDTVERGSAETIEGLRKEAEEMRTGLSEKHESHSVSVDELRASLSAAVADLTTRSDDNDQLHDQKLERLRESNAASVQEVNERCDRIEAAAATAHQEADQRLAAASSELRQQCHALDERAFEKIRASESAISDLSRSVHDDRRAVADSVTALGVKLGEHVSSSDLRVTALEATLVEKDEHQTARLAETEQTLMRSVEELHDSADRDRMESARVAQTQENKFDSLIEQHSERIARQHEHFTTVASSMASMVSSTTNELEETLFERIRDTETRLTERASAQEQSSEKTRMEMKEMHNELKSADQELDKRLMLQAQEHRAAVDQERNERTSVCADLTARGTESEREANRSMSAFSTRLNADMERLVAQHGGQDSRFTAQLKAVRSELDTYTLKFSGLCDVLAKEASASQQSLSEESTRQRIRLETLENKSKVEMERVHTSMEGRFRATADALESAVNGARAERARLEKELAGALATESSTAGADRHRISTEIVALSGGLATLEKGSQQQATELKEQMVAVLTRTDERAREVESALGKRLDAHEQQDRTLEDGLTAVRSELQEHLTAAKGAAERAQAHTAEKLEEQQQSCSAACLKLDDAVQALQTSLREETARARSAEKAQTEQLGQAQLEVETLVRDEVFQARREATAAGEKCTEDIYSLRKELDREITPKLAAVEAQLVVKSEKTELKAQMMMVDMQMTDVTDAIEQLAEEVRDEEPGERMAERLDTMDGDISDLAVDVQLLSATVDSVQNS